MLERDGREVEESAEASRTAERANGDVEEKVEAAGSVANAASRAISAGQFECDALGRTTKETQCGH
jgi:hypothetical protein